MIVVTGASRGLGLAVANRLLSLGKEVVGVSRNVEDLSFPGVSCDVSDSTAVKTVARRLRSEGHEISGVINAAGIASMNLALMSPPSQVEKLVQVNLLGTVYVSQAFAPLMIRRKYGRIINFSTIAVPLGLPGEAAYAASKAGVEAFSRSFAREVSDFGITVNCVAPGPINTDLLRGVSEDQIGKIVSQQIIRRQFTPEDVCDVVELLLDEKSNSISGQVMHVGGV